MLFKFTDIKSDSIYLKFKKPLFTRIYKGHVGYYCDHELLDIHSYGLTTEELRESIKEDIIIAWKLYVECNINTLSEKAKQLRQTLLSLVE